MTREDKHKIAVDQANDYVFTPLETVKSDAYRLGYHIMTPRGWMNDPNGLIQYNGEYHVFYQHYPYDSKWGPMHWGHVVSDDLVHWKHMPISLAPSEDYDIGGCFSGSAVNNNGILTLIYTGHVDEKDPKEVQCLAYSEDGVTFSKEERNPVIGYPPEDGSQDFRDPKVWKHEEQWYMVLGTGKDEVGKALLYRSNDLREWEYIGVMAESDGTLGYMWECPDLFKLGNKHVLVLSPMKDGWQNRYIVGELDYETGKFKQEADYQLDYGFHFYAPQTLEDECGRRLLIGWMDMWETKMPSQKNGWAGAMTIPRELTLSDENLLIIKPVSELEKLRAKEFSVELGKVNSNVFEGISGRRLEIKGEFELVEGDTTFSIGLCESEDGQEETVITYDGGKEQLTVDLQKSGEGLSGIASVPVALNEGKLSLHIFLDHSSLEVFVNDGQSVLTNRIYPKETSDGVYFKVESGKVNVIALEVWELKSIW
ncbi:glycoside hydrolase family 32 protein [Bacillus sp. DJP31]|uniref:glycoside hydrolase family 32 protein n=1 Tax=Bacillus sp. DJP31 TaxID=3409789 RepID=UPI003BB5A02E